jgi:hypothetical protein
MVDMSLIAGAVSSLKTASEIVKSLVDVRDQALFTSKAIELQRIIVDALGSAATAQSEQISLIEQIRGLQSEISSFNNWESTATRYRLKEMGGSTFAYKLKEENAEIELIHLACPRCFEKKTRSILQFTDRDVYQRDRYRCHACQSDFNFGVKVQPAHLTRNNNWQNR